MEMFTMVNGKTIKEMDKEFINGIKEMNI